MTAPNDPIGRRALGSSDPPASPQPRDAWTPDEDDDGAELPRPLTRDEAQALRARIGSVSPWRVIVAQAAVGIVVAALIGWFAGSGGALWSALYGAAAVVVPGVLLARGVTGHPGRSPGAAVFGFLFWEMVKVGVAVAMLVAAPRVVRDLSWPALLVAMIVCVKVNWFALLWRRGPKTT